MAHETSWNGRLAALRRGSIRGWRRVPGRDSILALLLLGWIGCVSAATPHVELRTGMGRIVIIEKARVISPGPPPARR